METRPSLWVSLVVITVGTVLLLVFAVFLVNREDASSVASASETAMVADNTLGVVAAIRTATNYAATYVDAVGGTDQEAEGLLDEIATATTDLRDRTDRLVSMMDPARVPELQEATDSFIQSTNRVVDELRVGSDTVPPLLDQQLTAMEEAADILVEVRDSNVESVLVAGEDVGRVATAVRFLVIFVIPLAVIVSIWRIQRRASERRLLAAEVEKQTQLADSRDAFVADVSHELRTPLTGIYGFAVALDEKSDNLTELQSELVGLIITEAAELSRMVDDLVALGRIDAGAVAYHYEHVDVAATVEQVILPFRRQGISFEHDAAGVTVLADPGRFRQILRNLVSNAVKYGGGEVAVGVVRHEQSVLIEVIDDGPGVPEAVVDRLFQRYVHGDGGAVVEGSVGLGLAIARSFAEGMGGSLRYVRLDDITIFQLELPQSVPAADPVDSHDTERPSPTRPEPAIPAQASMD